VEYFSGIKMNELLPFSTTYIELENMIFRKIVTDTEVKYFIISHTCGVYKKLTTYN
jgi:hypothetical protein